MSRFEGFKEAMDEIDRLRAEVTSLKSEIDWHVEEIKRLRQKLTHNDLTQE